MKTSQPNSDPRRSISLPGLPTFSGLVQNLLAALASDPEAAKPSAPVPLPQDPLMDAIRTQALDQLTSAAPDLRALRMFVRQALQIRRADFTLWKSMNRRPKRKNAPPKPMPFWKCSDLDREIAQALCARATEAFERCSKSFSTAAAREFRSLLPLVLQLRSMLVREGLLSAPADPAVAPEAEPETNPVSTANASEGVSTHTPPPPPSHRETLVPDPVPIHRPGRAAA